MAVVLCGLLPRCFADDERRGLLCRAVLCCALHGSNTIDTHTHTHTLTHKHTHILLLLLLTPLTFLFKCLHWKSVNKQALGHSRCVSEVTDVSPLAQPFFLMCTTRFSLSYLSVFFLFFICFFSFTYYFFFCFLYLQYNVLECSVAQETHEHDKLSRGSSMVWRGVVERGTHVL